MGFDWAAQRKITREALHGVFAGEAVYEDALVGPCPVTVRRQTKIMSNGALSGGYDAEIETGVDRLVFNATQLATANEGEPLVPEQYGRVTLKDFEGLGDVTLSLDTLVPPDGPENVIWNVVTA